MRTKMDRLTTTIKRPWLADIIAGKKKIEYRQIKPYWTKRLKSVRVFRRRSKKFVSFRIFSSRQRVSNRSLEGW